MSAGLGEEKKVRLVPKSDQVTTGDQVTSDQSHILDKDYDKFRTTQLSHLPELYPNQFQVTHSLRRVQDEFAHLAPGEQDESQVLKVAGRVHSVRTAGKKLIFADIRRDGCHTQVRIN